MEWIKAEELLDEFKLKFPLYFNKNIVDYFKLYPTIQRCLNKVGLKYNDVSCTVVPINNYKSCIPDGFLKLVKAYYCNKVIKEIENRVWYHEQLKGFSPGACKEIYPCMYAKDPYDEIMELVKITDTGMEIYNDYKPVRVKNMLRDGCVEPSCYSVAHKAEVEMFINGVEIDVNIKSGFLHLEYLTSPGSDDLYIPDNETIKHWILMELLHDTYQLAYYAGEPVSNEYNQTKRDSSIAFLNAKNIMKPEVYDLYKFRNKLFNKSKRYEVDIS